MALYAVLSDIHANFVALEAVEKDAQKFAENNGYASPRFICLGDVVDYGPQPNECMDWIKKNVSTDRRLVLGNHDQCVAEHRRTPPKLITSKYWAMTIWTRLTVERGHKEWIRDWQKESPRPHGLKNFMLVHASLEQPRNNWAVKEWSDAKRNFESFGDFRYLMFGHTHYQGYYRQTENRRERIGYAVHQRPRRRARNWKNIPVNADKWLDLPTHEKMMLNPGSVGQPRFSKALSGELCRDNRAAYMLLDVNGNGPGRYQFRRAEYDVEKTVQLLQDNVVLRNNDMLHDEHSIYHDIFEPDDFDVDAIKFKAMLKRENLEVELEKVKKILISRLRSL